eukprot:1542966-Pyramimonas_sp.AAC.1
MPGPCGGLRKPLRPVRGDQRAVREGPQGLRRPFDVPRGGPVGARLRPCGRLGQGLAEVLGPPGLPRVGPSRK